jgi:hypothetical protein
MSITPTRRKRGTPPISNRTLQTKVTSAAGDSVDGKTGWRKIRCRKRRKIKRPAINSTEYRAIGSHGELVIVHAADEVLQDYGEVAVQQNASAKYDLVEIQNNTVTVKTTDFR